MTRPPRVGLISCGLNRPAMFGYNRLSVCTADALAAAGAADFVWVGLPAGVHPAMAARLTGRVHQLPAGADRTWLKLQRAFLRAEAAERPDLWHVMTDEPVPQFARRPVVVTCTGLPRWYRFRHLIRTGNLPGRMWDYTEVPRGRVALHGMMRQWALWKLAFRKAAAVVAISDYVKEELVTEFGVPAGKIVVSYLAPDAALAVPRSAAALAAVRETYGLPPRFVVAVASLAKTKNTPGLLALAADLRRDADPVPVVFVAPAGARDEFAARAAALGLTPGKDVWLLFNIPDADLGAVYQMADVFVNLAWEESFALPVAEAMACGTPAVVSNTTALPEIVGDGGVLVDPRDPAGAAAVVREVLASPARRADLSAAAVRRAAAFSWEKAAGEIAAVYDRVLAAPK